MLIIQTKKQFYETRKYSFKGDYEGYKMISKSGIGLQKTSRQDLSFVLDWLDTRAASYGHGGKLVKT